MTRLELEAAYRKYFMEIRGWKILPLELPYDEILDFIEWRDNDLNKNL